MSLRVFYRTLLAALAFLAVPVAFGQTLANGSFATGDLTGWSADVIDGGVASVVQQGTSAADIAGLGSVSFPGGKSSYAAFLRSAIAAPLDCEGILTSNPFVPRSGSLSFYALTETAATPLLVLLLNPTADPIYPALTDILYLSAVNPQENGAIAFQNHEIDLSSEFAAKTPVRVQFRQSVTQAGSGFFSLIAKVDDGGGASVAPSPPTAISDLAVTNLTPWSATLSFTSPRVAGSAGQAGSYDVRYSLSPITEANFEMATLFDAGLNSPPAGGIANIEIPNLEEIQKYYFAIKTIDSAKNESEISNVVSAVTPAPTPGGPGLTVQYYTFDGLNWPPKRSTVFASANLIANSTRIEPLIDINYETSRPAVVRHDDFGARYSGQIASNFNEDYTFCTASDDGSRLWISAGAIDPATDPPLVDNWKQQEENEVCSDSPITLKAGVKYNLIEEYEQGAGYSVNRLKWSSVSQPIEIIPINALFSSTTLAPSPVGRVTGSITDASGAPVAGVTLQLQNAAGPVGTATTDKNGTYTLLASPGEYSLTGGTMTNSIPSASVSLSAGQLTTAPSAILGSLLPRGLGIYNGNFATGDFTGWSVDGIDDGYAELKRSGQPVVGNSIIPFPDGNPSWVANVRSNSGVAPIDSVGILISDLFIPNAATLTFKTLSQGTHVAPQILLLKPSADPVYPAPSDILLSANVLNLHPYMGDAVIFSDQTIDLSSFYNASNPVLGTAMRLEARQHTTEASFGWFTLFTDFDAGPVTPISAPPALMLGDPLGLGKITIADATTALEFVIGLKTPTLAQVTATDVDKDGSLTIQDVTRILKAVVNGGSL